MPPLHPGLPHHRPLAIAHRGGNSIEEAQRTIALGCDMIETDIWYHNGHLELRHKHRLGPLPILWERWSVALAANQLKLADLLDTIDEDSLLFLDLKGEETRLGPAIVAEMRRTRPGKRIALCGRSYPQLDLVLAEPDVTVFYSVGEKNEWPEAWPHLEAMEWPALSLHRKLATPETMARLRDMNATVVCWNVNTIADARRLRELGVAGFTSDNLDLLRQLVHHGDDALTIAETS
ncbi:MAG TPA: glycerophosphodiester phosphodiesterase [Thermomicrobiales bacterium]|nr:glycerophosphodiester phosphodiesterase [Thermomicrobiales bacterium]